MYDGILSSVDAYSKSINERYLIKHSHGKFLMGDTMRGIAGILVVTVGDMIMDSVQNVFLQQKQLKTILSIWLYVI